MAGARSAKNPPPKRPKTDRSICLIVIIARFSTTSDTNAAPKYVRVAPADQLDDRDIEDRQFS